MKMPSSAAMEIVGKFGWSSNVMRDGRLISQEYVVAEEIDCVLAAKDARISELEDLLRRWVNIAEHGRYGARTRFPLRGHPVVGETSRALGET